MTSSKFPQSKKILRSLCCNLFLVVFFNLAFQITILGEMVTLGLILKDLTRKNLSISTIKVAGWPHRDKFSTSIPACVKVGFFHRLMFLTFNSMVLICAMSNTGVVSGTSEL